MVKSVIVMKVIFIK